MHRIFSVLALLGVLLLGIVGCKQGSPRSETSEPIVYVTLAVYEPFVSKLCKGFARVETIVPKNFDIHFFEPKPSDMKNLTKAVLWFGCGESFEQKLLPAVVQHSNVEYVNLSEHIPTILLSGNTCHSHSHKNDGAGLVDLHIWMSPVSMLNQISVMQGYLVNKFPDKLELITENANDIKSRLEVLNNTIKTQLAPYKGDSILTSHPSLGYFCDTYGLEQFTIECEGKDPTPRDIEALLHQLQHTQLRCAFKQKGFPDMATIKIAKDLRVPLYELDPFADDYYANMLQITGHVAE